MEHLARLIYSTMCFVYRYLPREYKLCRKQTNFNNLTKTYFRIRYNYSTRLSFCRMGNRYYLIQIENENHKPENLNVISLHDDVSYVWTLAFEVGRRQFRSHVCTVQGNGAFDAPLEEFGTSKKTFLVLCVYSERV